MEELLYLRNVLPSQFSTTQYLVRPRALPGIVSINNLLVLDQCFKGRLQIRPLPTSPYQGEVPQAVGFLTVAISERFGIAAILIFIRQVDHTNGIGNLDVGLVAGLL